jgi:hypothetical protein
VKRLRHGGLQSKSGIIRVEPVSVQPEADLSQGRRALSPKW